MPPPRADTSPDTVPPVRIVARPPRRISRGSAIVVALVVAAVAIASVGTLLAAIRADGKGTYPGSRSGPIGAILGANPTLQGAAVDDFERAVSPGLGAYPGLAGWTTVHGAWAVGQGVATGTPTDLFPALAVTVAKHPKLLFQVDLLDVRPGSGLVFRYQDPENFWSVQRRVGRTWVLVRTLAGTSQVVRVFAMPAFTLGSVGVWLDGPQIEVALGVQVVIRVEAFQLATARGVGLLATGPETSFDNTSIYDG